MFNKLKIVRGQHGKYWWLRMIFYPVLALIRNPYTLLWSTLVTLGTLFSASRISDYGHFNFHKSINSLFYWNRALNIWRFGRTGLSPYLGLGNYELARAFHYTLPSLYAFWKWSIPMLFFGGLTWLASFGFWLGKVEPLWFTIALTFAACSTYFYANVFNLQNYNLVGWMVFPAIIFALQTESWIILAIAGVVLSIGSFTGTVILGLLALVVSIYTLSLYPLIGALPAGLSLALNFFPLLRLPADRRLKVLGGVLKAIGATPAKAKYVRQTKGRKLSLENAYLLALISQFVLACWFFEGSFDIYLLFSIAILLVNSIIIRFADEQSVFMLILTVSTAHLLGNENWVLLPFYWLAVSPIPMVVGYYYDNNVTDLLPKAEPFYLKPIFDDMDEFLNAVPAKSTLFMAFSDPGNRYESVFDGYRQLVELPAYRASVNEILFMPEWWGVFELNYHGAPQIWGREPNQVAKNMEHWCADYVIVYQEGEPDLNPKWSLHGFDLVSQFDWKKYAHHLSNHKYFGKSDLTWFLLHRASERDS